jgi:hypothetical protein
MEPYLVCESQDPYNGRERVLERLIHCIWSEQLFRRQLKLDSATLNISSPGWWNLEAGPDFRNAELFVDGNRICGDVEIHLSSGEWYQHKHHQDPRYNQVVLHVVLYSTGSECVKQNGELVPELELKDSLMEELRLLQSRLPVHQFPFHPGAQVHLCRKFLEEHDDDSIIRILDSAGDLRMRRKKERYLTALRKTNFNQAFYEGVMEGMGYKQSRYAFRELAQRIPIDELMSYDFAGRRGTDSMASILLGTAGLLEELSQIRLTPEDPETSFYLEELFQYWQKYESKFKSRVLTGFCWYPSSTRPANFPARRLTAVASFFHYHGMQLIPLLLHPLGDQEPSPRAIRDILKTWNGLFGRPNHLYWSYHFQFDCHKFTAPRRLIGKDRSKILVINVILPLLLAHAELSAQRSLETILHAIYRRHPKLTPNSITRLMEHRMFGTRERAKTFIDTAHRQQSLHHFFYDFCDNRDASCSRCEFNPQRKT